MKNSVLDGMTPSHGPRRIFRLASVLKKAYVEYADVNVWMDKDIVVHIQIYNIIQPQKNEDILLFVTTWMDFEDIMVSEINQTEKDKTI